MRSGLPLARDSHRDAARALGGAAACPELYPDAVTLVPGVLAEVAVRSAQDGPGCSIKDSFADLELGRLGFDELFQAQWIFREPALPSKEAALAWSIVETNHALAEWAEAPGLSGTIRSELLRDSSVRILAARGPDGTKGGAIANQSASVVGVSNVFTTTGAVDEVLAGIANAVAGVFPSLPLVGYEQGEHLQAALAASFTAIGSLRVWLRRPVPAWPAPCAIRSRRKAIDRGARTP